MSIVRRVAAALPVFALLAGLFLLTGGLASAEDVIVTPQSLGVDLSGSVSSFYTTWAGIVTTIIGAVFGIIMIYKVIQFIKSSRSGV